MTYKRLPNNLPQILRNAGLKVVEVDGWQDRGRPANIGGFDPKGVLCHHTATGPKTSRATVVNLLVKGRSDLPGPLCHMGLGRDGTVIIIASGRANHAGKAKASGNMPAGDGNVLYIGIEAFNNGTGEPWSQRQMDAYALLCATLSKEITHNTAASVRGHKETSTEGKIDPTFDMNAFRKKVGALMTPPKAPVVVVPDAPPNPFVRPKRVPPQWRHFKHLDPKHYMNYYQALMHLGPGDSIDIDGQRSKRGTGWALHWATVGANHLHDPKGLIKPSRRIDSLSDAEIGRLKGPNGERTHRIVHLLKIAHRRGVRVELELKVVFLTKTLKRWLTRIPEIKALNEAGKLQFKALAESGGAIVRLEPAHRAGGTTIMSFTKYTGEGVVKERAWPVVDYVRGTPKWR